MQFIEALTTEGTHLLSLQGRIGQLEMEINVPKEANFRYIALLGHPHSLQGGTMQNKVVTTLVRVFNELKIPAIRFNFRGVGGSEGEYDAGIGESEDMLFLAHQCLQVYPNSKLLFAGFSFGSYVAYRAASQQAHDLLLLIAPSVEHYNYAEFNTMLNPLIVVQGDQDEVVPAPQVFNFIEKNYPIAHVLCFEDTGHFFHGKLIELKSRLIEIIRQVIAL